MKYVTNNLLYFGALKVTEPLLKFYGEVMEELKNTYDKYHRKA